MMSPTDRELMDIVYRRHLGSFVYFAFTIAYPDKELLPNWHIDVLCEYLQAMVEGGKPPNLVLNQPPRSLKTFIVSICFPAWLLIRDPTTELIVASYSDEIAKDASRNFRSLIDSEFVQRLSNGALSNPRKATENEFETEQGGGRFATSVGGTLTGRGADVLIIDDPIKAEDAYSEAFREAARLWFDGTAYSRRNRPGKSLCIVSMQRLHEYDLAGYLVAQGWPLVSFPLYDTQERIYELGGGLTYLRLVGELLQPGRDSLASYEQTRIQIGSALFNAQYLQAPIPAEGNMVKRDGVAYYTSPPDLSKCKHIILACDPAGKAGLQNDFTAIVIAGIISDKIYILDVRRGHMSCLQIVEKIHSVSRKYGTTINLIETTGMGESARQELKRVHRIDVKDVQPKNDKITRLSRVISKLEGKRVLLPKDASWLGELERELFGFPNTRFDDQIDALIMILEEVTERESRRSGCEGITLEGCIIPHDPYLYDRFGYHNGQW